MPGAAPGGGSGGAGGLFSSGKVGGSGRGAGLGLTPLGVKRRLLSGSCSRSSETTGAGPQGHPVAAWGGSSGLPQPLSCVPEGREEPPLGEIRTPPVPVTPGCAWGPARQGKGTLFYALKPRYPQPRAAAGRAPRSRQQQAAPSPCPARRGEPVHAWGSDAAVGLAPSPGLGHPAASRPARASGEAKPGARCQRQHWDGSPGLLGPRRGDVTQGRAGCCGTGAAPGVLELHGGRIPRP